MIVKQTSSWMRFQKMAGRLAIGVFSITGLLMVSGCIAWPLLYKPDCDIDSVLALHFPKYINTLASVPRTETVVKNGINESARGVKSYMKERFYFRKQGLKNEGFSQYNIEYTFVLYFKEADALEDYESEKHACGQPIYREVKEDGNSGFVCYTRQARSPEIGLSPTGVYDFRSYFRLRNAVIRIVIYDHTSKSDKLNTAVKDLAQMLNEALSP